MNVALRTGTLDLLSICTGGGGLDLGIGLALPSARSVCLVEREAFAVAQLVSAMRQGLLHPAPVWSDARTFDGRAWRGCVDGLIGGIPCQPHSLAGRKQGSLDERDLWSDARRIIVQSRAWFVLIENVGGMLSAGADEVAGAERVWRDLRKLGFKVEIGLFSAAEVGASHERERVFILGVARGQHESRAIELAYADDARSQGRWDGNCQVGRQGPQRHAGLGGGELADPENRRWHERATEGGHHGSSLSPGGCGGDVVDAFGGRRASRRHDHGSDDRDQSCAAGEDTLGDSYGEAQSTGRWQPPEPGRGRRLPSERRDGLPLYPPGPGDFTGWRDVLASAPELEPAFRRVADGLASRLDVARVDRLRMLGNGVVPLQAAYAVRTLATRLAGRGSAGAARLVRMMEDSI